MAVSPAEAGKLAHAGVKLPSKWVTLDPKEPKTVFIDSARGKVAVIYFPEAKKPGEDPSEAQLSAIQRAVKEARSQAKLVVGVSPWGSHAESDFLEKTKPGLDILLGLGSGVGFSAKPAEGGRVLHMRSYTKGKAIYTLDLLEMPSDKGFKWEQGTNYTTQAVVLDDSYPPAPAMEQLLQGVEDPGDKQAK
ncbi:hypothetical protein NNJEOMEG_03007 [Fundidesulfovibrio magnetotacticus]|uniref:Uncharacterized protein n=1 Tax=Fundidesulfovibrio magnetotacticus TaxID=2730080 RepID=A0A6V8LYR3_9BACT|nr:hypothetical protein [Fundidesulfovibrio magnetotacticus]GFK95149.1 hypothetical protein NNJEOMEG_03007 [Fundidesulfovibrio magnetotacticus]